jgi:hypothetical protein
VDVARSKRSVGACWPRMLTHVVEALAWSDMTVLCNDL